VTDTKGKILMTDQYTQAPQSAGSDDKKTGRFDDATKLDMNNLPDLLTVREVADLLRVSPLTIKRWGKRGKLPAIRINSRGDRRYKKEAVLWLLGVTISEGEGEAEA
jgi:excisionase family DNA binding protein